MIQHLTAADAGRDLRAVHLEHALRSVDRALVGLLLERRDLLRRGSPAPVDLDDLAARFSNLNGDDLERIECFLVELSGGAA